MALDGIPQPEEIYSKGGALLRGATPQAKNINYLSNFILLSDKCLRILTPGFMARSNLSWGGMLWDVTLSK